MTPDVLALRDNLEALAGELLRPELASKGAGGCYIVTASEARINCRGEFAAMTASPMALWLKNEIGDRWRGNGPAMLLHDGQILKEREYDFESAVGLFYGCFVHELAHIVLVPGLFCQEETAAISPEVDETVFRSVANQAGIVDGIGDLETVMFSHGPKFIRTALHISHRMEKLGFHVPLPCIGLPEISNIYWYRSALGDECERLSNLPLMAVVPQPFPKQFTELWKSDISEVFSLDSEFSTCS